MLDGHQASMLAPVHNLDISKILYIDTLTQNGPMERSERLGRQAEVFLQRGDGQFLFGPTHSTSFRRWYIQTKKTG